MREVRRHHPDALVSDGPQRGQQIEVIAKRLIWATDFGRRGFRNAVYDLGYLESEKIFYYTFRGWEDDPTWQRENQIPPMLALPGWIDVPVAAKFPVLSEKTQEEVN